MGAGDNGLRLAIAQPFVDPGAPNGHASAIPHHLSIMVKSAQDRLVNPKNAVAPKNVQVHNVYSLCLSLSQISSCLLSCFIFYVKICGFQVMFLSINE